MSRYESAIEAAIERWSIPGNVRTSRNELIRELISEADKEDMEKLSSASASASDGTIDGYVHLGMIVQQIIENYLQKYFEEAWLDGDTPEADDGSDDEEHRLVDIRERVRDMKE